MKVIVLPPNATLAELAEAFRLLREGRTNARKAK